MFFYIQTAFSLKSQRHELCMQVVAQILQSQRESLKSFIHSSILLWTNFLVAPSFPIKELGILMAISCYVDIREELLCTLNMLWLYDEPRFFGEGKISKRSVISSFLLRSSYISPDFPALLQLHHHLYRKSFLALLILNREASYW